MTARGRIAARALALAAIAAMGGGCGGGDGPTAPSGSGSLPAQVTQVHPLARATRVPYDTTSIWAEFDTPLDSTSVNTYNVYLKRDTQRLPIVVRWDAAMQRVRILPQTALDLLTTYTVELSPHLRNAAGETLGERVQWQFTTNGLRRPSQPSPSLAAPASSPFVTLGWGGLTPGVAVAYEFYADVDSVAVANRSVPYRSRAVLAYHLPTSRWPAGTRLYWAVTAERLDSGERFPGPVWSFATLPADAPVDSVVVTAADYAWAVLGQNPTRCLGAELITGVNYMAAFHPSTGFLPPDVRVAGVRLEASSAPGYELALEGDPEVCSVSAPWTCNTVRFGGPPFGSTGLARAVRIPGTRTATFQSDALNAHFEAMIRRGDQFGYVLRSGLEIRWVTPQHNEPDKNIRIIVYRYTGSEARR